MQVADTVSDWVSVRVVWLRMQAADTVSDWVPLSEWFGLECRQRMTSLTGSLWTSPGVTYQPGGHPSRQGRPPGLQDDENSAGPATSESHVQDARNEGEDDSRG